MCAESLKSGNSGGGPVFEVELLGADVETINGTMITKKGLQDLIRHKLGVQPRQARAAVNSYVSEGWAQEAGTGTRLRLHDPVCDVDSAAARVLQHIDDAWQSRITNGKAGWPPRK